MNYLTRNRTSKREQVAIIADPDPKTAIRGKCNQVLRLLTNICGGENLDRAISAPQGGDVWLMAMQVHDND
jgi:hypothetical protein